METPATSTSNHRRPPAQLSVSLRNDEPSSKTSFEESSEGQSKAGPEIGGPHVHSQIQWHLSNESNGTGDSSNLEDAQKWFDRSNKHLDTAVKFVDNEPPYFLPNISSDPSIVASETSFGHQIRNSNFNISKPSPSAPNNESITDDYRSVIDDLTVENKKLKERLRKLEKKNRSHLDKDKLFEVKIHSLPARKRRELEDTLRAFTSSLENSADEETLKRLGSATHPYPSFDPASKSTLKHAPSSSTSNSRLVDSAYASMSHSGLTSSSTLHHIALEGKLAPHLHLGKDQKVQRFLHNIPQGSMPRHLRSMTERQKKKIVVLRLEQLFIGKKGVVAGKHSQSAQQQEVSNSAARADRAAETGPFHMEGVREANIQEHLMDLDNTRPSQVLDEFSRETQMSTPYSSDDVSTDRFASEQRPTRPLDLDPDRAQIPSENVDYIRHLGVTMPNISSEYHTDSATDVEGWIYLNLLINLAQLHIINVTPEFVRTAVSEVSEKFQLSEDGKKLRWRGGLKGTQLSSDSGDCSGQNQSSQDSDSQYEARKRRRVSSGKFTSASMDVQQSAKPGSVLEQTDPFHYKPLFNHRKPSPTGFISSDESDSASEYGQENQSETGQFSDGPRMCGAISQSGGSDGRKRPDEGPIVFYSGAKFYTDLSGDKGSIGMPCASSAGSSPSNHGSEGLMESRLPFSRTVSGSLMPCRPFKYSPGGSKTPDLLKGSVKEADNYFEGQSTNIPSSAPALQDFDASGLGGTQPADHFTLRVETRRTKSSVQSTSLLSTKKFGHSIPMQSLECFRQGAQDSEELLAKHLASLTAFDSPRPLAISNVENLPVKTEVLSTEFYRLEPSTLPPPLGYHASDSSSDEDSEVESVSGPASQTRHHRLFNKEFISPGSQSRGSNTKQESQSSSDLQDEEEEDENSDYSDESTDI